MNSPRISVATEIAAAISHGRPVVALESTLIAHGLPWPDNRETAMASEAAVRDAGAIPATIAVLGGVIRVGLSDPELMHLARAEGILKASRRDLAAVVARKLDAATTVSATMRIARTAGIRAMATGGLGGVHRGAGATFDVSTDLDELALAGGFVVVCSGVKTILDVPATLEAMETRGILVVGYRTNALPGFTIATTGLPLEWRADSPGEIAEIARIHEEMGLPGAIVVAQEVPAEVAIDRESAETALESALKAAGEQGVEGKRLTPFLLDAIRQATGGRSLRANRALIINNARLAGELAAGQL